MIDKAKEIIAMAMNWSLRNVWSKSQVPQCLQQASRYPIVQAQFVY